MHRGPYYKHREGGSGGWNPYEERSVPETVQLNAETKKPIGLVSRQEELAAKAEDRKRAETEARHRKELREQALREALDAANGAFMVGDEDGSVEGISVSIDEEEIVSHPDLGVAEATGERVERFLEETIDTGSWTPVREEGDVIANEDEAPFARADGTFMDIEKRHVENVYDFIEQITAGKEFTAGVDVQDGERVEKRFRISGRLGAGGMGETYLARAADDPEDAKPSYVVKIHDRGEISNKDVYKRKMKRVAEEMSILHEMTDLAEGVARYQEPNGREVVVSVMKLAKGQVGQDFENAHRYKDKDDENLTKEQQELKALAQEMETDQGVLKMTRALDRILEQLEMLAAKGIAHQDVKSANMLIADKPEESTLIDTGLASQVMADDMSDLAGGQKGAVQGTPTTMLPDIITQDFRQRLNGDIYSAVASFTYMLGITEVAPSTNESMLQQLHRSGLSSGPDIRRKTGRAKFLEQHNPTMLMLYDILEPVLKPGASIKERHRSWQEAGLTYAPDEELFQDKYVDDGPARTLNAPAADSRAFGRTIQSKETYIAENETAEESGEEKYEALQELGISKVEEIEEVDKTKLINIRRLRHRIQSVATRIEERIESGQEAVNQEEADAYLNTGEWPAAA